MIIDLFFYIYLFFSIFFEISAQYLFKLIHLKKITNKNNIIQLILTIGIIFYALTGFHGLHVTLGAIMILIVWWQARSSGGRITSQNNFPFEAAEVYWHFVDGIWVVLFIILYLL